MLNTNGMKEETITRSELENADYVQIIASVIETITQILEDIIKENMETEGELLDPSSQSTMSAFCVLKPPNKPINEYFQRIIKYAKPEPSSLIISLMYIDKICDTTTLLLSYHNIHRVILSSIVLAIKYNEDDYYSNTYYAKVGGITLEELNGLEYQMLQGLEFNTFVDAVNYSKYESQLITMD